MPLSIPFQQAAPSAYNRARVKWDETSYFEVLYIHAAVYQSITMGRRMIALV